MVKTRGGSEAKYKPELAGRAGHQNRPNPNKRTTDNNSKVATRTAQKTKEANAPKLQLDPKIQTKTRHNGIVHEIPRKRRLV
jgi:hypothetical protein